MHHSFYYKKCSGMKKLEMKLLIGLAALLLTGTAAPGQCETWENSPRQEDAENAHVVYRQFIRNKDYKAAYEHWKRAYEIAPAADGRRDSHFTDGIEIYKYFYDNETDEAKKAEYQKKILSLYDQAVACLSSRAIVYRNCEDETCVDQRIGWMLGRKAFDMYYKLMPPRAQTLEVLKQSVAKTGNTAEYIVLNPYADIIVYLFSTGQMEQMEARAAHTMLYEIADYGIENDANLSAYFQQAKDAMDASFAIIESRLFDCEYFVDKHGPEYEADPTNIPLMEEIIRILKRQGCDSTNAFLAMLEDVYRKFAEEYNAELQAEFERNNPAIVAKRLYDSGDYQGAIARYQDAIGRESDPVTKATYHFAIASIQFRKLGQYVPARESARTAARLRAGWGRPYMLIGDMYAQASRSCGNNAYSRGLVVLAAVDKWAHARSIDREVLDEANRKIATYSQHLPPQEDAFMMGKKEGQTDQAGCWVGETVTLRFN